MRHYQTRNRRVIASLLTTFFLLQQSMVVPAMATSIGGGADGWVTGENGVYNIDPTARNGNVGYRKYENFDVSAGDVANLIYKYGSKDIETFVNLVDNQININGIVNTMRDGNFYNGKAVFISPNGMVVGASGVLNVGSLSVATPTTEDFNAFKNAPNTNTLGDVLNSKGNGVVTVNGKIITSDHLDVTDIKNSRGNVVGTNAAGVEISAGSVDVGPNGGIVSGVQNMNALNRLSDATALFTQLVNTNNITNASSFAAENGKIVIVANDADGTGANVAGNLKNFGQDVISVESNAGVKIASTGKIDGDGISYIHNTGNADTKIEGNVVGKGVWIHDENANVVVGHQDTDNNIVGYQGAVINL